jgi:hypothetical protein
VLTNSSRMKETQGISDLAEVTPDVACWKTAGVVFDQVKKVGRRWLFIEKVLRGSRRQDEIVIVIILEEIKERANVGMAFDRLAFYPGVLCIGF